MPSSPSPAFFRLNYHSAYGIHTMQVPTLAYATGDIDTWVGGNINAQTMIEGFVDLLLPFYPNTVEFDNVVIFSQPTPSDEPVPVEAGVFTGKVGTSGTPGWTKAVQLTMSVRTTNFGTAKYVFLDAASGNTYDPLRVPDTDMQNLLDYVGDTSNGFSGQDNGRPNVFVGLTKTLNEKLRKAYRMA